MTNTIYSKSSNLSTSVQKRRTLYLAESDPRANKDFITKYMNDYYAEVVVMTDAAYMAMIAAELGQPSNYEDDQTAAKSLVSATAYSQVAANTVLQAPTGLYWDYNDSSATKFVTVNGSNYVNINVSFDPGDELPGSLEYEYYVDTTGVGAAPNSTAKQANAPIDKTKITFTNNSSSIIQASWDGISDAIGYTITVTGANCPPREFYQKTVAATSGTAAKRSYYLNYDPSHPTQNYNSPGYKTLSSNGRAIFKIVPVSGKSFSGNYTITFQAHYTNGTSDIKKSPKATFAINGGVTIV